MYIYHIPTAFGQFKFKSAKPPLKSKNEIIFKLFAILKMIAVWDAYFSGNILISEG